MTKPCPLYFKPADVLAAFSGDLESPAEPVAFARRSQPMALRRFRSILSTTVRRRWRQPALPQLGAPTQSVAACGLTQGTVDLRLGFAAVQPHASSARGLLSHYAMVQPGA